MRRAAILLASLSILSISALALTGALVDSRRADAYFESELLCGERDSFEGVSISASTSLSGLIGNRLYYGLSYDAASDESACEYSFNERTSRSAADTDKEPVYAGLQVYFEDGAVRWELYDPQSHEELGSGTSEELGALTEGAQSLRCYRLGRSWVIEAAYTDTAEYRLLASRWSEEYGLYVPDAGSLSLVKSCSSLSTVGEAPDGGLLLLEKVGADYLLSQFDASGRLLREFAVEGAENLHFSDYTWGGDWVTVDVLGTVHSFVLRDGLLERSTVYRLADAPGCHYFVSETEDGILFYYERQYSFDGERLCLLVEEKAMQYQESSDAGVPLPEPGLWLIAAYPDGAVSSLGLRCSMWDNSGDGNYIYRIGFDKE